MIATAIHLVGREAVRREGCQPSYGEDRGAAVLPLDLDPVPVLELGQGGATVGSGDLDDSDAEDEQVADRGLARGLVEGA